MGKIAFFGDSITQAQNVEPSVNFTRQIGLFAGYALEDIINAGIAGNKTSDMLARVDTDVIALAPEVCVIMPLTNDANHSIPLKTFASNLNLIVSKLLAANIKVVMISPPLFRGGSSKYAKFNSYLLELEQIVENYNLPYIDLFRKYAWEFLVNVEFFTSLYVDIVHQTPAGYNYISNHCNSERYAGFFVKNPQDHEKEVLIALADWATSGMLEDKLTAVSESFTKLTTPT